jgi:hypothetical protein
LSKLLKLKEWLTVPDAARHLSILLEEEVSEADVLRLALDGKLRLSVRFMDPSPAVCGTIHTVDDTSDCFDPSSISDVDKREDAAERATRVLIDDSDNLVLDVEGELHIDGIWDLLMRGGERAFVENKYQKMTSGPAVYPFYLEEGIYLVKELAGTAKACRLRPELPDGGIPNDSHFVVRTVALQELENSLSNLEQPEQKPLGKREKDTLLVIIAALAQMAKLKLNHPSAAATAIESATALMGARVSDRTILNHLNRIPDALADKAED